VAPRDRLERAIRLAAPQGYLRAFLDEGAAVTALLPPLRHLAPSFVSGLLKAFIAEERTGLPSSAPDSPATTKSIFAPLGKREIDVLRLAAEGHTNHEIANKLFITVGTTKCYLNRVYGKLGARNRAEAIAHARRLNLL
jgi:LuxR family maltose regulon positive regulatory protein